MDDKLQIVKSLLITAGTLRNAADSAAFFIGGSLVVPISPSSLQQLAELLERAANELIDGGQR